MSVLMLNTRVQHISALKTDVFFVSSPSLLSLFSTDLGSKLQPEGLILASFVCVEKSISLIKINYSHLVKTSWKR